MTKPDWYQALTWLPENHQWDLSKENLQGNWLKKKVRLYFNKTSWVTRVMKKVTLTQLKSPLFLLFSRTDEVVILLETFSNQTTMYLPNWCWMFQGKTYSLYHQCIKLKTNRRNHVDGLQTTCKSTCRAVPVLALWIRLLTSHLLMLLTLEAMQDWLS